MSPAQALTLNYNFLGELAGWLPGWFCRCLRNVWAQQRNKVNSTSNTRRARRTRGATNGQIIVIEGPQRQRQRIQTKNCIESTNNNRCRWRCLRVSTLHALRSMLQRNVDVDVDANANASALGGGCGCKCRAVERQPLVIWVRSVGEERDTTENREKEIRIKNGKIILALVPKTTNGTDPSHAIERVASIHNNNNNNNKCAFSSFFKVFTKSFHKTEDLSYNKKRVNYVIYIRSYFHHLTSAKIVLKLIV